MALRFTVGTGRIVAALLVVAVLISDTVTPLGLIVWLLYALPVLIVSAREERRVTYAVTAICIGLTWVGIFLSPPGVPFSYAVFNRSLGSIVLWSMAVLLSQRRESRERLARQNALLETRVQERTAALDDERERLQAALAALSESEARYRAIGELIPYGVWVSDPDGAVVYLSESFLAMIGKTLEECRRFDWIDRLPPEDVEQTLAEWQACRAAGRPWDYTHHVRATDGSYRHVLSRGVPMRGASGEISAWVGIHLDVTERVREAEELQRSREQLQGYARRFVEEVENERRTIARELHDEAGQSLTAIKIALGLVEQECRRTATHLVEPIRQLRATTDQVMEGLHRLSRNLRPASLDQLGLVAALRQHCHGWEQQTGVVVEFVPVNFGNANERLPEEIEMAVYRIAQEALTNVARHASAHRVGLILKRKARGVVLIIEDDGHGFDPVEAMARGRLGLLGMRERVELIGGRLTVESRTGQGTTVFVSLPTAPPAGRDAGDEDDDFPDLPG